MESKSPHFPERTSSNKDLNSQQFHQKQPSEPFMNHSQLPPLPAGAGIPTPPTPFNETQSIDESFVTSHTFPANLSTLSNQTFHNDEADNSNELPGGVAGAPFPGDVVPTTFDDSIYNALCDLEVCFVI